MAGPMWLDVALAVLMVGSAGYHLDRLRRARGRGRRRQPDVAHLVMSGAMAVMLVSHLGAGLLLLSAAAFVPFATYFVARSVQALVGAGPMGAAPALRQALAGCAMVVMLAAGAGVLSPASGTSATSGTVALGHHGAVGQTSVAVPPGATEHPAGLALTCAALLVMIAVTAAWQARGLRRPSWQKGCQLAMSATMAYMLALML
ncbi:DUF5134 domain-containing protein [Angustibacter sp. McL0619]|uniref:DUF5134 domain-containing protein n=1 Tax=Angustibacter sp. McL0619 TaxID=3415676 RepID=UPI003CF6994B